MDNRQIENKDNPTKSSEASALLSDKGTRSETSTDKLLRFVKRLPAAPAVVIETKVMVPGKSTTPTSTKTTASPASSLDAFSTKAQVIYLNSFLDLEDVSRLKCTTRFFKNTVQLYDVNENALLNKYKDLLKRNDLHNAEPVYQLLFLKAYLRTEFQQYSEGRYTRTCYEIHATSKINCLNNILDKNFSFDDLCSLSLQDAMQMQKELDQIEENGCTIQVPYKEWQNMSGCERAGVLVYCSGKQILFSAAGAAVSVVITFTGWLAAIVTVCIGDIVGCIFTCGDSSHCCGRLPCGRGDDCKNVANIASEIGGTLGSLASCASDVAFLCYKTWSTHIENAQALVKTLVKYLTHQHILDTALKRIGRIDEEIYLPQEDIKDEKSSAVTRPHT